MAEPSFKQAVTHNAVTVAESTRLRSGEVDARTGLVYDPEFFAEGDTFHLVPDFVRREHEEDAVVAVLADRDV